MAVTALVHALNAGETSIAALARIDQEKLRLAAEIQENILPWVIGKGQMRPATGYLGASSANNQARGIPFIRSVSAIYGLELTNALLRIWTPDSLLTRASVTSTVTNGDFSSATGWTLTATGGGLADINSTVSGALVLSQVNRGGTASCTRSVSTSSGGTEHALRIVVARGPVLFKCGSASGADDYITTTTLDTGEHSLAFTPSGTYYVEFQAISDRRAIVDSITVESAGTVSFAAPWSTAELRQIKYDQSVDVMWLAHTNWQTRKIERRGAASWSLVKYQADDGPFAPASLADRNTTLTPGAAYGNTTLTASQPAFRSSDVGSLIRINCTGFDSTYSLAADGAFTEPVRVRGVNHGTRITVVRSGTWTGNLSLQMSLDGPKGSFSDADTATLYTNNGSSVFSPNSALNNVTMWFRVGFGPAGFGSGVAAVQIQNAPNLGYATARSAGVAGIFRITAFNSSTSVDVEVLQSPSSVAASAEWRRGEWSDRRGWPRSVAFHDGRIWFGRDDRPAGSVSDNYYSFATEREDASGNLSVTADSAILKNIAVSGQLPTINWMLSLQRLIVGTDGTEISARADAFDAPLTPTASSFKSLENIGVSPVSPVKFGKRAFYVSAAADKVLQLFYNFEQQDYDADDLMERNEDLGNGGVAASHAYTIVEMFVQRKPEPYLWAIRSDGQVLHLLFSVKHGIQCWTRQLFDGASGVVESGYVLPTANGPDRVYLWVKRTINGSTVRYLEKLCLATEALGLATTKLGDAGTLTAGPVSSVTLAHLASQTGLVGWGTKDGVPQLITGLSANGSGVISLGATYTNVWVGLPYTGRYKSSKLAYGAKKGTALLQKKRVSAFGILASQMHRDAITAGKSFSAADQYPLSRTMDGQVIAAHTVHSVYDEVAAPFAGTWDTDSRLCLQIAAGHPATINGLVVGIETNEL